MAKFKDFHSSFKDSYSSSGTGWGCFFTFIGTIFLIVAIISKLIGESESSWWWILATLWITVAILYKELRK